MITPAIDRIESEKFQAVVDRMHERNYDQRCFDQVKNEAQQNTRNRMKNTVR